MRFLTALLMGVILYTTPSFAQLVDSGPLVVSSNGEIIENKRITANGAHGIECVGKSNVVIRNVEVLHQRGRGIKVSNCDGITIVDAAVEHTGTTTGEPWEATGGHNNIEIGQSDNAVVRRVRLRGGASGVYVIGSRAPHISFVEGYNFRGPFPRGQVVQFNQSPDCVLEDFSVVNTPGEFWSEDNVNGYGSPNCIIRRGLVDGNNSNSGVGVLFENGPTNGNGSRIEDVDAIRMGNGAFTAWGPDNVVMLRTRWRDNICTSQDGRGEPSSGGQGWVFASGANNGVITAGRWFNKCWSTHWISGTSDATVDIAEEDFALRQPIVLQMPWEGDPEPPLSGMTVAFTDTSTDPDGNVVAWAWDFGDGGTSAVQNPSHTYAAGGTYTVSLTVTDNDGATGRVSRQVMVSEPNNAAPTAAFTITCTDLACSVDGSSSNDSDGSISGYAWDFGDGNVGSGITANHTYAAAGTYAVGLTVTDDDGDTADASLNITVNAPNQAPSANFDFQVNQ